MYTAGRPTASIQIGFTFKGTVSHHKNSMFLSYEMLLQVQTIDPPYWFLHFPFLRQRATIFQNGALAT